jgi:hypothetical protein
MPCGLIEKSKKKNGLQKSFAGRSGEWERLSAGFRNLQNNRFLVLSVYKFETRGCAEAECNPLNVLSISETQSL